MIIVLIVCGIALLRRLGLVSLLVSVSIRGCASIAASIINPLVRVKFVMGASINEC